MSVAFSFIVKAFTGDQSLGIPPYKINNVDVVKEQIYLNNMVVFQGEGIDKNPDVFWNKYRLLITVKPNFVKLIGVEEKFVSKIDNEYTYDIIATRMENFDVVITSRETQDELNLNPVLNFGENIFEYLTFYQNCKKIRDKLGILYMQPAGNIINLSYSEEMTNVIKKAQGFSIKYKYPIEKNIKQENLQSVLLAYQSIDSNSSVLQQGEFLIS